MKTLIPKFSGYVQDGKLHLRDPERYKRWVSKLEGERLEVVIKKARAVRSLQQNKYYWAVVIAMIADHCGMDSPEEAHEAMKWQFLQVRYAKIVTVRSTTSLSKSDMVEYIERIRRWAAAELNLDIPDPHKVDLNSL